MPHAPSSRAAQLLTHLDTHRAALLDTLRSIPPELHLRKPAPDRWSVAEVVEHLALVEPRLTQLLSSRIAQAPPLTDASATRDGDVSSRLDHARVLDRGRPITAGEAVQPRQSLPVEESLATLTEYRERLRALVSGSDGLDLAAVTHPHPALGPLDLEQWILFVGSHEARHTAQIREIVASVTKRDT
jgi:uncharacterized damage-inducible protein DinB